MEFSEKLRQLMDDRQITGYKIYKETGISQGNIASWLKGDSRPKEKNLQKLCDYLDVPTSYFSDKKASETSQVVLDYMAGRNISAYKVAQATGISQGTFSKWRANPTSNITTEVLNKIAEYLQVPVADLIGERVEHKKKAPPTLKEAEEAYVAALTEHGYLKPGKDALTAEEMERLRRAARIALDD